MSSKQPVLQPTTPDEWAVFTADALRLATGLTSRYDPAFTYVVHGLALMVQAQQAEIAELRALVNGEPREAGAHTFSIPYAGALPSEVTVGEVVFSVDNASKPAKGKGK